MSKQALEGINVVEFAAFAAGPGVGKHLADFGATVVRVESRGVPDGFRTHYPPYPDNKPGVNRSGTFALFNSNKMDVTLDLKSPGSRDIVKRIARWADVVVENMTPGTVKKLGVDYETLREHRPDIIMLSTCNQGQFGPHAKHPGFGSHLSSLSGFTNATGYPDGPPNIVYGPYIDFIGVGYGFIGVIAALEYRRRTGKGQYIDNAQYENGLQFIGASLLDYSSNGNLATRMANRSREAAPHGAYRCRGEDRWCVLSCSSDEEWRKLCAVMGQGPLGTDARFATLAARKQNEEELDQIIAAWTSRQEAEQVVDGLQSAGLRSAPVNTMRDIYACPQLRHRNFWHLLDHAEMGKHHYEDSPFKLSKTPSKIQKPAPLLGEHNEYFYTELLGIPKEEYEQLVGSGVIN
ncbi:MAG: CoA transferase [Chloroflexi bacterium]|nr:CoA transferase [Chloroflexota bacterium]